MRKTSAYLVVIIVLLAATAHAGLLTGQTPSNHTIPDGWSLIKAQDFETPCTDPNEYCELWATEYKTDKAHGGTTSIGGTYTAGQDSVGWKLLDSTGSWTELYISYYEWVDADAKFNDEYWMAQIYVAEPEFQELILDWYWPGSFNNTSANLYAVPQGNHENNMPIKWGDPAAGAWVQWEIHYRQNTPGNSDGFIRVYRDGALYGNEYLNQNINGTVSMNNASIQVGGIYTKGVWMNNYPSCTVPDGCCSVPGDVGCTDYCSESMTLPGDGTWSHQSFASPVCDPIDPAFSSFGRWIDDIIIMKTEGSPEPPSDTQTSFFVQYTRPTDWAADTEYTIGVTAQDVYSNTLNESYTFHTATETPETLAVTTTTLTNGKVGDTYSATLAATGGVSPYTWDNTTVLPAGLSIPPSGTGVWGVPTATFSGTITVRATDSVGATDNQDISFTVDAADIPGYPTIEVGTVEDTYMVSGSTQNFSTGDELYVYTWPTAVTANRILMKWDLSSVSGTVPTTATLRLYMIGYEGTGGDNTYSITARRITGVNPTVSAASWVYYNGSTAWTGGADGGLADAGAVEATTGVGKTPQYVSLNVTEMVKAWLLDPSTNKGMLLGPAAASQDSNRHFGAYDNPTAAYRPVLFLTYVPIPSPNESLTVGTLTGGIIQ